MNISAWIALWIASVLVAFGLGHWMGYWYGRWVAVQEYISHLKEEIAREFRELPPQGRG